MLARLEVVYSVSAFVLARHELECYVPVKHQRSWLCITTEFTTAFTTADFLDLRACAHQRRVLRRSRASVDTVG